MIGHDWSRSQNQQPAQQLKLAREQVRLARADLKYAKKRLHELQLRYEGPKSE